MSEIDRDREIIEGFRGWNAAQEQRRIVGHILERLPLYIALAEAVRHEHSPIETGHCPVCDAMRALEGDDE